MFKTETELKLELFPRNWTETETEIMSGTEISLGWVSPHGASTLFKLYEIWFPSYNICWYIINTLVQFMAFRLTETVFLNLFIYLFILSYSIF